MMFCLTHGREHYPGETEDVTLLGDDLTCREVEWTGVVNGVVVASSLEGTEPEPYYTPTVKDLAYLDTRTGTEPGAGLVPVKVVSIEPTEPDDEDGHVMWHQANLKVTAGRPGFTRGETIAVSLPNPMLLARDQVYRASGRINVMGPTRFLTEEGELL